MDPANAVEHVNFEQLVALSGQLHAFIEQHAEQVPLFLKQLLLLLQQGKVLYLQPVKQLDQFTVAREQSALVSLDLMAAAMSNQWRPIKA